MKNFKNYIYILAAISLTTACKPTITVPVSSAGSLNLTRYIAVGNSLTAGYADGGLYLAGQLHSYPSIIAKQMQSVNSSLTFNQPLFTDAQANGTGYLKLTGFDASGNPITASVTTNLAYTGQVAVVPGFGNVNLLTKYTGSIDNYGVPGIKLVHLTYAPYANLNPYFDRMLTTTSPNSNTTYLSFITAKPFTFFTNWLGNNDALGYATGGGGGYTGADVLTDQTTFTQLYTLLIGTLTQNGAKGVCTTIPDVTTIPYFTTLTQPLILANVQKAVPSVQAIFINAANTTGTTYTARAATANDLFVLTFPTSLIGSTTAGVGTYPYGLDPRNPIESKYVLDANEVALVKTAVSGYNNTIKAIAASKGLAVFDAFTFLTNVKTSGLVVNGVSLNSSYISGGLFSLDGVHLTPRGYAIVANEYIKVINSKYGSSIPLVNVASYNGVLFP
jgi:hypothetical protein